MFPQYTQIPIYNPSPQPNPFAQLFGGLLQQPLKIPRVNGREGAVAYQIPPGSEILLLDNNEPIIWLVQTDDAGTKTADQLDISIHMEPEPTSLDSLERRIKRLEDLAKHEPDYVDVAFTEDAAT